MNTLESEAGEPVLSKRASALQSLQNAVRKRIPVHVLIWTGVGALTLALILGSLLGATSSRAGDLEQELADKNGKIQAMNTTVSTQDQKIGSLEDTVAAAVDRESELAATEATLTTRAAELDAREAAIKKTETTIAANTIPGDGVFMVGIDVKPGRYKSAGGSSCYWSRMNAAGDDTIDNYIGAGPAVLTIQSTDGLVKTSHCEPFTKVG